MAKTNEQMIKELELRVSKLEKRYAESDFCSQTPKIDFGDNNSRFEDGTKCFDNFELIDFVDTRKDDVLLKPFYFLIDGTTIAISKEQLTSCYKLHPAFRNENEGIIIPKLPAMDNARNRHTQLTLEQSRNEAKKMGYEGIINYAIYSALHLLRMFFYGSATAGYDEQFRFVGLLLSNMWEWIDDCYLIGDKLVYAPNNQVQEGFAYKEVLATIEHNIDWAKISFNPNGFVVPVEDNCKDVYCYLSPNEDGDITHMGGGAGGDGGACGCFYFLCGSGWGSSNCSFGFRPYRFEEVK